VNASVAALCLALISTTTFAAKGDVAATSPGGSAAVSGTMPPGIQTIELIEVAVAGTKGSDIYTKSNTYRL